MHNSFPFLSLGRYPCLMTMPVVMLGVVVSAVDGFGVSLFVHLMHTRNHGFSIGAMNR